MCTLLLTITVRDARTLLLACTGAVDMVVEHRNGYNAIQHYAEHPEACLFAPRNKQTECVVLFRFLAPNTSTFFAVRVAQFAFIPCLRTADMSSPFMRNRRQRKLVDAHHCSARGQELMHVAQRYARHCGIPLSRPRVSLACAGRYTAIGMLRVLCCHRQQESIIFARRH